MIEVDQLCPPSTSSHICKFEFTDGRIQPNWAVISFDYSKDISAAAGEGTLSIMFDEPIYTSILKGDPFIVRTGWEINGVECLMEYISGEVQDVLIKNYTVEIKFKDLGLKLEEETTASYASAPRSKIVEDLITKAGLKPSINWGENKDDVISYHGETSNASSGGDDGTCVTFTGYPQCGDSSAHPGGWVISTKKWSKKCPNCGKNLIQITNKKGVNWPGHPDGLTCGDGTETSNGASNGGCDCDFCGICGKEAIDGSNLHLYECTGTTSTDTADTSTQPENTDTETTDTTAETTTDAVQTEAQKATYWDMLTYLLSDVGLDMQIFVWMDYCYVQQIPPMDSAVLFADDTINIEESTISIGGGVTKDTINKVIVKYGDAAHPQEAVASHDELIKICRKENTKVLDMTKNKWDAEKATYYAYQQLNFLVRDDAFQVDLTTIGHPEFYVGRWVKTTLSTYGFVDTYYLTRFQSSMSGDSAWRVSQTLKEYAPSIKPGGSSSSGKKINPALLSGTGNADTTSLKTLALSLGSPEAIRKWMRANIKWEEYYNNKYTDAEVLAGRRGNCYDQASTFVTLVHMLGWTSSTAYRVCASVCDGMAHCNVRILINGVWKTADTVCNGENQV